MKYTMGRGGITMGNVTHGLGHTYRKLACSQDLAGWGRFMGDMVSKVIMEIQQGYFAS
jgi:hypothetical protein